MINRPGILNDRDKLAFRTCYVCGRERKSVYQPSVNNENACISLECGLAANRLNDQDIILHAL